MARRGDALRDHILRAAKDVFLEVGFERAAMDEVANRARTSKRSLYAHFESKEKLFLAVIDYVRGLFLTRLRQPGDYAARPEEALALFGAAYLEALLYKPSIQMIRICMAEAERFPEPAARHFDVLFTEVHARLTTYLKTALALSPRASAEAAHRLIGQIVYPRLPRALFGLDALVESFAPEGQPPDLDLKPIRKAVAELMASIDAKPSSAPPRRS
jgi:AcrR family transcriptional regulator